MKPIVQISLDFTDEITKDGQRREGSMSYLGQNIRWDEKPFEWVAGREQAVERLYRNGPIKRLLSHVRLVPEGGVLVTASEDANIADILEREKVLLSSGFVFLPKIFDMRYSNPFYNPQYP